MWGLYILMALLTAGVAVKTLVPLIGGHGRFKHRGPVTTADRALFFLLIVILPLLPITFYLFLGKPELRGSQAVFKDLVAQHRRHNSALTEKPLRRLLEEDPNDIGALMTLGALSMEMGKPDEALIFLERGYRLARETDDYYLRSLAPAYGEAIVFVNNGHVTPEAKEAFDFTRSIYPQSFLARYYLALYRAQNGEKEAALDVWYDLLTEGRPHAGWKERVRASISTVQKELLEEKALKGF